MRLTEKENNGYRVKTDNPNTSIAMDISNAIQKLGQLEDIEDELGIDLITLFKALKNGIWVKHQLGQVYKVQARLYDLIIDSFSEKLKWCFLANTMLIDFKDYGKTWALTKEELEK